MLGLIFGGRLLPLNLVRASTLAVVSLIAISGQAHAESFGECAMFQSILLHEHREGISPDPELHAFIRQGADFKDMARRVDLLVPTFAGAGTRENAVKWLSEVRNIDPTLKQGMLDCLHIIFPDY